jgi:hypothetical protein
MATMAASRRDDAAHDIAAWQQWSERRNDTVVVEAECIPLVDGRDSPSIQPNASGQFEPYGTTDKLTVLLETAAPSNADLAAEVVAVAVDPEVSPNSMVAPDAATTSSMMVADRASGQAAEAGDPQGDTTAANGGSAACPAAVEHSSADCPSSNGNNESCGATGDDLDS